MKRFYLVIICAFLICNGCRSVPQNVPSHTGKSNFITSFSLPDTVNIPGAVIKCSGPINVSEVGDDPATYRKVFSTICQAEQPSKANWDQFISVLKDQIERELKNSGARIMKGGHTGGGAESFFRYDYQEGKNYGGVDVVFRQVEPGRGYVACVIREVSQMP